ncbi:MAG TPA: exosortase [Steroidobacteraceae bacterium]|nr:exosortase [Steroidobacteraceae bacterium]
MALLYWPSALELHRLWTDWGGETYTHGYLILLLSLWLIVRDRERLAATPVRPEPLALIPLALMSVAWVWFWRAAIQELQLLLLPLILCTAIYAAFGRRMARAVAFPIAILYFAMPLWGDINGIVQALSAKATGALIWATGIPAYMEGDFVRLPGGSIEIARSCSGLHELIVGLALAAIYGKLSGEPWRRRLQWLGLMGALSLMVNWVRIFTVVIAAYETNMSSSLVKHHYWLGWWLFAFVFAAFLWWTGRAAPRDHAEQDRHNSAHPSGSGIASAPLALTLAVLAAMPALAYGIDLADSRAGTAVTVHWPTAPAGWTGPTATAAGGWQPHFVDASGESLTRYTDAAGAPVAAYAVAYRVQTQSAKLLGYWNDLLGHPEQMRQQSLRVVASPVGRWQEIVALGSDGSRSLIWTRYRIGSRVFVQPRMSQLWYGLAATVEPPLSSLTALRTACLPDCNAARARLSAAAGWLRPALR